MNRFLKIAIRYYLPALFVALWFPALLSACPNCKDGMSNDPNGAAMVNGYFWSIVFMMLAPYTIFTLLGVYLYSEVRRARRKAAKEQVVVSLQQPPTNFSADRETEGTEVVYSVASGSSAK